MFNIHQYYKFCEKGSRMENVRFEEVKQTFNVAVVRSFISDYPTSKNLAQSKQKLNDLTEYFGEKVGLYFRFVQVHPRCFYQMDTYISIY